MNSWTRHSSWLRLHRFDVGLLSLLCLYSLASRWITLEPVELSGDPLDYWYFVKQWFYGGEFGKFDHHDARFGIHIWLFLVQLVFGQSTEYTYVAPLFAHTVMIGLAYVLTRQISTRAAAAAVVLVLCEYDEYVRAASQIRPSMFSAMYMLAVALSLVFYARAKPEKRFVPLACVVGFLLLSYLAWDPNVFFTPGVLLVMLLTQRRPRDVLFFAGLLLVGFLGESLLHYVMVGGTRLSSSLGRGSGPPVPAYSDLVLRLTKYLHDSGKLAFYPFLAAGPALLGLYVGRRNFSVALTIVLLPLIFLALVTFSFRGLDPVIAVMPFHPRYLNVAVPFTVICSVVVLQRVLQVLARPLPGKLRFSVPALSAGAVALLAAGHTSALFQHAQAHGTDVHPFIQARRAFETLSDAYARGLPIVGPADKLLKQKRYPRSPPLHWAHKGFVHSDLLLNPEGKLPRFNYIKMTKPVRPGTRTMYIPQALPAAAVNRNLRQRRCVVQLIRKDRFVQVKPPEGTLPQDCNSLRP